jgi:hypothetical protein
VNISHNYAIATVLSRVQPPLRPPDQRKCAKAEHAQDKTVAIA